MNKLLQCCVVAVALMAAVPAHAVSGLGLRGDSGLARTPLAVALPPLTLAVAMDYVSSDDVFLPTRLEIGVIKGLEIGGNYWYLNSDPSSKIWGLNAKYVLPEFVENLGLAVGGHFRQQSTEHQENDGHDVYLAVAYRFGFLLPTVGVIYESITGDNSKSDARFFGSLVADILPNLAVGAEIESASDKLDGADVDPSLWFGTRYQPVENFTLQVGLLNNADFGSSPGGLKSFILHVGAQYAFSFIR